MPRRLRCGCNRTHPEGSGGAIKDRQWGRATRIGHGGAAKICPLQMTDPFNHVVLDGLIAADPQRDRSRDGAPITVLLVSFLAPDEGTHWGSACCEVEVLDEIADGSRESLRAGASILVAGEITGAGGIWAKLIIPGRSSR